MNDKSFYRKEVETFVKWCDLNFLELNVSKTKEIVFDFRKKKTSIESIYIHGARVETVSDLKFLGTFIDSNMNWNTNTKKLVAKANQRMFFIGSSNPSVSATIFYFFSIRMLSSPLSLPALEW